MVLITGRPAHGSAVAARDAGSGGPIPQKETPHQALHGAALANLAISTES